MKKENENSWNVIHTTNKRDKEKNTQKNMKNEEKKINCAAKIQQPQIRRWKNTNNNNLNIYYVALFN